MNSFLNGYTIKYRKKKLHEHCCGNDIIISSITGKSSIVSFHDSPHKIIHERWLTDNDKATDASSEPELGH